jgi:hypothetical protein
MCACGRQLPDALSTVTRACTDGAAGDDVGVVFVGDIGDGQRVCMDSQTEVKRARLAHGCPPRAWWIVPGVVPEAALAAGKLTRDGTGGQLTFPEVIRSRRHEKAGTNQRTL